MLVIIGPQVINLSQIVFFERSNNELIFYTQLGEKADIDHEIFDLETVRAAARAFSKLLQYASDGANICNLNH